MPGWLTPTTGPELEQLAAVVSAVACIIWIIYGLHRAATRLTLESDHDTTAREDHRP